MAGEFGAGKRFMKSPWRLRKHALLALALGWSLPLGAQEEAAEAEAAAMLEPEAIEAELLGGTLADLVERPEEPVERLVLRDQSAQEVLPILSDLLERPFLPASDLPVVKISFDSRGR